MGREGAIARLARDVHKVDTRSHTSQPSTPGQENAAAQEELTLELLRGLNTEADTHELVRALTGLLQRWTRCHAVGVRLRDGYDYPYFETRGFPSEFVRLESSLCELDAMGVPVLDGAGNAVLECMCGNVIRGRTNPALEFFTPHGTFWTNSTTRLLAETTEGDRQSRTRNRCHGEGYESVALIPLRHGGETLGLLQLNDREPGRFGPELLSFLESCADQIAITLANRSLHARLRESEETYRALVEAMPDVIVRFDRKGRHIFASRSVEKSTGIPAEGFLGKTHRQMGFPAEQCDLWEGAVQGVLTTGRPFETRFVMEGQAGPLTFDWRLVPERDGTGEVRSVLSIARDITAERRTEEDYRSLFREMPESFAVHEIICDTSGRPVDYRFLAANPAFERLTGLKAADIIGRTVMEVLPKTESFWIDTYGQVALTGRPARFEYEVETLGRHVDVAAYRTEPGRFACIVTDVTDRRDALDALQESEGRYRLLTENIKDVIWVLDLEERRFLYVSPAVRSLRGFTPAEVMAQPVDAALVPEGRVSMDTWVARRVEEFLSAEREGTRPPFYTDEVAQPCREGPPVWTEVTTSYRRNPRTGHIEVHGVSRDITERRRAEEERLRLREQLLHAQKMESVGRLAGGVAHDFNNMLAVILGHAEIALEKLPADSPGRDDLVAIQRAAQRSADLTRQLLAFARKQAAEPKVLDLNQTLAGMLGMLRRLIGENIDLVLVPATGVWKIRVDPAQIDQILANLSVNSRDAISGVGRITISMENVTVSAATTGAASGAAPGDYVRLSVADTGCGMTSETLEHLYEPFYTTKEKGRGTGLGLATVYGIVQQNGGFIDVRSAAGSGTTVSIHLPRDTSTAVSLPGGPDTACPAARGGGETLLLVEDEVAILAMGRTMLERLGYVVLAAPTPAAALEIAAARAGEIDLLITDVVMPGMNGRDLAEAIRVSNPEIACLYMSGYTADVIAHQGVLDPSVVFLQKPFASGVLSAKVREALATRR